MQILKILGLLEKLESTMSELYATFARTFRNDPEAALFFDEMSMEESLHVNLIKFQKRIVTPNLKDCKELDFDSREVEMTIEKAGLAIKSGEGLPLEAALKMSLEIENGMAEQHFRNAVQSSFPDIVKLMSSLTSYDCRHFEAFLSFARKKGFHFDITANAFLPACPGIADIKPPHPPEGPVETESGISKELLDRIEYLYEWQDQLDYYKVLGVGEFATPDEIRRAFRNLAKELHPDLHINLSKKLLEKLNSVFSRIDLAYSVLRNESSRMKYNESLPSRHH